MPEHSQAIVVRRSRVPSKPWMWATAVATGWMAGCGSSGPSLDGIGATSNAILGGQTDDTHSFAVAVVQTDGDQTTGSLCSGTLLAPNLVATARHCVAQVSSLEVECSQASFGSLVSDSTLFVTTDATVNFLSLRVPVAPGGIVAPSATQLCGNDIALIILNQNIMLPGGYPQGYVVPAISPPLTDPTRSTVVTAIGYGYGKDASADSASDTAGTRRVKENIGLACIPNDPNFIDCFSNSSNEQALTANEFVSASASVCEGDSGSSVYDQAEFDVGVWVGYGVLSRGGCGRPIYTRFDAWGPLIIQAAQRAAALGNYSPPPWATGAPEAPASKTVIAADGAPCDSASVVCHSSFCVSFDDVHKYCASECVAGTCASQFVCEGSGPGHCFPASGVTAPASSASSAPSGAGGCALGDPGRAARLPAQNAAWAGVGMATLSLRRLRRRRAKTD